jgi:protein-disulfide isomerase
MPPAARLKTPVSDRDHIQGPASAPVELVEYGDFECPHCGRAAGVVDQLRAELGDKLRFVFRHFPLSKMHPHARKAAEASEAAAAEGKFWEMHDLLFKNSAMLSVPDLTRYAAEIGLDADAFIAALTQDTYSARVQEDLSSGVRSGVNGTPTFFINGVRHSGGYELEALRAGIATATEPSGSAAGSLIL